MWPLRKLETFTPKKSVRGAPGVCSFVQQRLVPAPDTPHRAETPVAQGQGGATSLLVPAQRIGRRAMKWGAEDTDLSYPGSHKGKSLQGLGQGLGRERGGGGPEGVGTAVRAGGSGRGAAGCGGVPGE